MKVWELTEDGRIVKGVNTTSDVSTNQIPIEANKFGNKVDKDGRPPTLSKKVKGKSTNVLYNLGLAEERFTPMEMALMEGGHSIDDYYASEGKELASTSEIYVDMDGVLVDFFGEWAKLMNKDHFTDIDDVPAALQKIRDTDDFWLNIPKTSNADQLLNIIKQVKGSYKILSSPLADDPNSEPHKREWIKNNLQDFPPSDVIITHDKAAYAQNKDGTPNILIDDFGINIKKWTNAGGVGFKHKDHKFERTAKAIQQHMKQPVENESINEGLTSNLIKWFVSKGAKFTDDQVKQIEKIHSKYNWNKNQIDKLEAEMRVEYVPGNPHAKIRKHQAEIDRAKQDIIKIAKEAGAPLKEGIVKSTKEDIASYKKIIELAKKSFETDELEPYIYDAFKIAFNMNLYQKNPKLLSTLLKVSRKIAKDDWPEFVQDMKKNTGIDLEAHISENFADGKKKGKSRPGRVKRAGASCKGSVTKLRKQAKNASGERAKMYHWCANMKSGRKKG